MERLNTQCTVCGGHVVNGMHRCPPEFPLVPEPDPINHPAHYVDDREYETWDVIIDWKLSYCLGSAVKYISRAGKKGDAVEDLNKAIAFINKEIERLQK